MATGAIILVFAPIAFRGGPLPRMIARVAPTDALIMAFAGHMVASPLLDDAYEAELLIRIAKKPETQGTVVQFLADVLAGKRSAPFPHDLHEWGSSSLRANALSDAEVDLLAAGAWRGVRRGVKDAAWFWQEILTAAPEVAERVLAGSE